MNDSDYEKCLSYINDYDNLTSLQRNDLMDILYPVYLNDPHNGAWAEASRIFVSKIPADSDIISISPEAIVSGDEIGIWAAAEIPTILDTLPEDKIFDGYTIRELKNIRDLQEIEAVKELLKEQSIKETSGIKIYYGTDGDIVHMDASYSASNGLFQLY